MGLLIRREDTGAVIFNSEDRMARLITTVAASGNGSFSFASYEGDAFYFVRFPRGVDDYQQTTTTSYNASSRVLTWTSMPPGTQIVMAVF